MGKRKKDYGQEIHKLELPDRIYALWHLLDEVEFERHLYVTKSFIERSRRSRSRLTNEIEKLKHGHKPDYSMRTAVILNKIQHHIFIDAGHSMAAVGMIAPLYESFFENCFKSIGKKYHQASHFPNSHTRWKNSNSLEWDCHYKIDSGRVANDIVQGIFQLSDALSLTDKFPNDLRKTLTALFGYRNCMFHGGLEWSLEDREGFIKKVREQKLWSSNGKGWFNFIDKDKNPWLIYMTDYFIKHCLTTLDRLLDVFGAYAKEQRKRIKDASS